MDEAAFIALDGDALEALALRVANGPYLSVIVLQNSGGLWHSWLGTADGSTAYFTTGGNRSEEEARQAVERAARYV